MTEWILIVWLAGCGWNCDTSNQPTFPPYDTERDCNNAIASYLSTGGKRSDIPRSSKVLFGPLWNRRADCEERPILAR